MTETIKPCPECGKSVPIVWQYAECDCGWNAEIEYDYDEESEEEV